MNCNEETVGLMHKYLDGDLTKKEEIVLRAHLEECAACQQHFHELSRTITLIQNTEEIMVPVNFTEKVMQNLPTEKGYVKYISWLKKYPFMTIGAILFLFIFSGLFSTWSQDNKLVVSKQEDLIITGDRVIVPEGITVTGDLFVKNGDLQIDGKVDGNVTLINGKLITNSSGVIDGDELVASIGEVSGELTHVNQLFEWIWYKVQNLFENVFSLGTIDNDFGI